jgi:hypothetical protein
VCKECRYGVLPSHIARHLTKRHKLSSRDAQLVAEEVESWGGLAQYASEVQVPETTIQPISGLPVFTDGHLCQLDPGQCRQVFRSVDSLRKHWQRVHGWSAGYKKGRPSSTKEKVIHQRTIQGSILGLYPRALSHSTKSTVISAEYFIRDRNYAYCVPI